MGFITYPCHNISKTLNSKRGPQQQYKVSNFGNNERQKTKYHHFGFTDYIFLQMHFLERRQAIILTNYASVGLDDLSDR